MVVLGMVVQSSSLKAAFVSVSNPGSPSTVTAQIVRAGTTLQGSIVDPSNHGSNFRFNGDNGASVGSEIRVAFQVGFDSLSGNLGLSVDFNRDGTLSSDEKLTLNLTEMPNMKFYRGQNFKFVSISVTESSPFRSSTLADLTMNGNSLGSIRSGEATSELFFQNTALNSVTEILIGGNLMLTDLTNGRSRTAWNFSFSSPTLPPKSTVTFIPEPAAGSMFILGGMALAYGSRRLRSSLKPNTVR